MRREARGAPASAAVLEEMRVDTERPASEDKLDACRRVIAQWRDNDFKIADLEAQIKQLREQTQVIRDKTLVDLFDKAEVNLVGLPASGNLPAYEVRIDEYFHANIPPENMEQAAAWMTRTGNEDLIKTEFKLSYGLGEKRDAEKFEKLLIKRGDAYDKKQGVPWNTLTAFVKGEFRAGRPLTKKVMGILGATSGRVATIVVQKKGKK